MSLVYNVARDWMHTKQLGIYDMSRAILSILIGFFLPLSVLAEVPDAPVILDFGPAGCVPQTEVCGDGIDQDCNGSDKLCAAGADSDLDGFVASLDCNDADKKIYPGISVPCSAAGCSTGSQTCQANGSYTACSCTPLCEATGSGQCRYISKLTGNDSNPGTFEQPWKTFAPIFHFRCFSGSGPGCPGDVAPANTYSLQAGDVVYVMSALYNESFDVEGTRYSLHLSGRNGTAAHPIVVKAYPGAHPVIAPASQAMGIYIHNSSHVLIEGFEVNRAYQHGVRTSDSSHLEFRNMWVHDTDGVDNSNIAGVRANETVDWSFHHSLIHDNYDRTNADTGGVRTENSRNIVLFGGGNVRFHHNVIFQTPATTANKTGSCIVHKHPLNHPGGTFEVDHNIFRNCYFAAIGSCSYGGRFHHNLIIDSDESISIRNHGGPPSFYDNVAEYNTIINTPGFRYSPTEAISAGGTMGLAVFRKNIVVDNHPYNTDSGGILRIDTYGTLATQTAMQASGDLQINENCYHNTSHPVRFAYYSNIPQGGLYTLAAWQGKGYDLQSFVTDPQLNADNAPQNASCSGFGYLSQW